MATYWQQQAKKKAQRKAGVKQPAGATCPVCGAINCDRHQQQPVKKSSSV